MSSRDDRRKVALILLGSSILTLVFAAVILAGVIDLDESVRPALTGILVFVAIADVIIAWRFFLTPRA
jgi:hypothetical protein